MIESTQKDRDLSCLVVPRTGHLVAADDRWEPYRLLDSDGARVAPAAAFLRELMAVGGRRPRCARMAWTCCGGGDSWWRSRSAGTARPGLRRGTSAAGSNSRSSNASRIPQPSAGSPTSSAAGAPNPATGKPALGDGYAPATVTHSETVLRGFYDFHRDAGTGPILNPFPLDASRRSRRAHAHHNPMDEWKHERTGRYRPSVPQRIPRAIPDDRFNELFAALPSNRDRALVAFWISTGARASELLGVRHCDVDPGQQLITLVRKGSRATQQVPASADAFVWLRLYQEDLRGKVPRGRTQPLWWTLRRPHRPLTYHAAHRMFERANAVLGADWTLHALRHSAASRMARDPQLTLSDVQWVLELLTKRIME